MADLESDRPSYRLGTLSLLCIPLFGLAFCAWSFVPSMDNLDFGSAALTGALFFGIPAVFPIAGLVLGSLSFRRHEPRAALTSVGLAANGLILAGSCFFWLLGIGLGGV